MIFSLGNLDTFLWTPGSAANTRVSPPTRPKNISKMRISRDIRLRPGVIPRDSPTVPMADAVSNRQVSIGSPSMLLITMPQVKNSTRYISRIVAAFLIVSSGTLRPKKCASSF